MKTAAHQLTEIENRLVGNLVPRERSVLLPPDDPRGPKHRQVFRDVRLSRPHRFGELSHGGPTISELVKQPDPHRFADNAKTLGNEVDEGRWERVGNVHTHTV